MSFSGMVKEELSRQVSTARHCRIAEIAALLSACGRMTADGILHFQTENYAVVRKYFTLLTKTFNIDTDVLLTEKEMQALMQKVGNLEEPVNGLLLKNTCCQRAFLRGAFLSVGSISDPEKGYHLEFVCEKENLVDLVWKDRPAIPCTPVVYLSTEDAGESVQSKVKRVLQRILIHYRFVKPLTN